MPHGIRRRAVDTGIEATRLPPRGGNELALPGHDSGVSVMIRTVREQLITVEEATRLSRGESERDFYKSERPSIWSWQTVAGVMSQTVSDEMLGQMATRAWKKR
jgi:hypothetical protein